jgi:hypothetical protein
MKLGGGCTKMTANRSFDWEHVSGWMDRAAEQRGLQHMECL